MHRNRKAIMAVLLVMVMVVAQMTSAAATTLKELEGKQAELATQIKTAKDAYEELKTEKDGVLAEVTRLDVELDEVTTEYLLVSDELAQTTALLEQTEIELAEAEAQYEAQYAAFRDRVRYMYENGSIGYLETLFTAESFSDFLNQVEYINCIVEYDENMVTRLQETENTIAAKLQDISEKEIEVSALAVQLERKKHAYEEEFAVKEAALFDLMEDEAAALAEYKAFEDADKVIQAEIKKWQEAEKARIEAAAAADRARAASSSVNFDGQMRWPVPSSSRISSGYGYRTSPISGRREFHTGIDIPAATGNSIIAAEKGVVVTAGWINGYGYTVVLDHGGNVTTLYGHCSRLLVSVGQSVARGQEIARIGSTGWSTGPHLHFQVMERGGHVTPSKYLNY